MIRNAIPWGVALFLIAVLSGCTSTDSGLGGSSVAKRQTSPVVLDDVLAQCKTAEDLQIFGGLHPDFVFHFIQMRAAGWDTMDLDTMVAVSGASGLFAYQEGTFFPKYYFRDIEMEKKIEEATGFAYEWVHYDSPEEAWSIIKESVDTGRPVRGPYLESVLFLGYQDATVADDRKVCVCSIEEPGIPGDWWTWKQFLKWWDKVNGWRPSWDDYGRRLGRFTGKVSHTDERTVALQVIERLVAWHDEPPEPRPIFGAPEAIRGPAAIEAYGNACGDLETHPDFGMCHGENPQWTMRKASATYLRRVAKAKLFPAAISDHFAAAASEYFSAYHSWAVAFHQIGWGGPKEGGKTKEVRLAASQAILNALQHENNAVAELKKALAAEREAKE